MKKISLPKIGIRPVIDGRRMGVRESLEEQTMNMAKATAAVKTSDFYRDYCFENDDSCISGAATSHVDDKHLLDIDDLHCVAALLADTAALQITPLTPAEQQSMPEDFLHIGYLPRKSLLQLAD